MRQARLVLLFGEDFQISSTSVISVLRVHQILQDVRQKMNNDEFLCTLILFGEKFAKVNDTGALLHFLFRILLILWALSIS
jgi:hypothetical protein